MHGHGSSEYQPLRSGHSFWECQWLRPRRCALVSEVVRPSGASRAAVPHGCGGLDRGTGCRVPVRARGPCVPSAFARTCPEMSCAPRHSASSQWTFVCAAGAVSGHGIPYGPFFRSYLSFVVRQILALADGLPYILHCTYIDYTCWESSTCSKIGPARARSRAVPRMLLTASPRERVN